MVMFIVWDEQSAIEAMPLPRSISISMAGANEGADSASTGNAEKWTSGWPIPIVITGADAPLASGPAVEKKSSEAGSRDAGWVAPIWVISRLG